MSLSPETLPSGTLGVFFSYAHEDEQLRNALAVALAGLRRDGLINEWYDREIISGQEFDVEIDRHIENAKIILLLVSADFINSDYCWGNEVARALERHRRGEVKVIPVILRPTDWKSAPFAKLQALPRDARPVTTWENIDAALEDVAIGVRKAITDLVEEHVSSAPAANEPTLEKGLEGIAAPTTVSFVAPSTEEEAAERIRQGLFNSTETDDIARQILNAFDRGGPSAAREEIWNYLNTPENASISGLQSAAGLAQRFGFPDLASRLLLEACNKAPNVSDIRRNLVVALSAFDQDDLALPFARRLVAEHPDNEDYVELLAQVLASAGHNDEAWAFTNHELEKFRSSSYLFQFALASGREIGIPAADLDAMATEFLAQDFPDSSDGAARRARAHGHYGSYLARLDRDKEAVDQYSLAFRFGESSPTIRGNYAVELAALGNDEDAREQFRISLDSANDAESYSKVQRQYVMFLIARGKTGEAGQVLKEAWEARGNPSGSASG